MPTALRGSTRAWGGVRHYATRNTRAYQDTLRLPRTAFQLRASAKDREPLFRPATTERLYLWQRTHLAREGVRDFVLHDGPPYANGSLHMGMLLSLMQVMRSTKSSKT